LLLFINHFKSHASFDTLYTQLSLS
jgi:hypothetical protein